jgi:nitroreductase
MLNVLDIDMSLHRTAYHEIENLFVRRWSPRAMSGEPIANEDLMRLLEAARWAPSSYNEQPWRFLYARRDTKHWPTFLGLLVEGNRVWCERAAVLFVIVAKKTFTRNGSPNPVAVFDSGAAWANLALQGASMHLVVHGMAGFDAARARTALGVPDDFDVCAMVAVGKPGYAKDLPEKLREMEKPSGRRPVAEISSEGAFRG